MINTRETFNNVNNIPTFIINLDDDVERMESAKTNLNKMNIGNFTRISGFKGYDKKRLQKELPQLRFAREKGDRFWKKDGALGCACSHIYIWKKIIDENIPRAIILEDDFLLIDNFNDLFIDALKKMPSNGIFYNFTTHCFRKCEKNNTPTWENKLGSGAIFYIITLEAAKKLYNYCTHNIIDISLDRITQNVIKNQGYKLLYHNENKPHKCGGCGIVYTGRSGGMGGHSSSIRRINNI